MIQSFFRKSLFVRLAAIALWGGHAAAQSPYSVTPIQAPPNGALCDLNAAGKVAGAGPIGSGFSLYTGSVSGVSVLPLPAGWQTAPIATPVAINDLGQVLGSAIAPGGAGEPYITTASGTATIPIPAGWAWAAGTAINNFGQVAGYGFNNGAGAVAFAGSSSAATAIPLPNGATQAETYSINASGEVAGAYYIPTPNNPSFQNANQAFTAIPPAITTVVLPQPNQSLAVGINDSGQVAGWLQVSPNFVPQAFTVSNSTTVEIPLPAGAVAIKNYGNLVSNDCGFDASVRSGHILNNTGFVIGNASTIANSDPNTSANSEGWLWNPSQSTRLLSTLVPAPWTVINAISIANSGMILAYGACSGATCPSSGNYSGYILLTPQGGACDLDGDLNTNAPDVQLVINQALGTSPVLNDFNQDGVVNVVDIQIVMNAALGMRCAA